MENPEFSGNHSIIIKIEILVEGQKKVNFKIDFKWNEFVWKLWKFYREFDGMK